MARFDGDTATPAIKCQVVAEYCGFGSESNDSLVVHRVGVDLVDLWRLINNVQLQHALPIECDFDIVGGKQP